MREIRAEIPAADVPWPRHDSLAGEHPAECEIDLVHLSRQTMGDKELEVELLSLFARQARAIVRDLSASSAALSDTAPSRRAPGDLLHTLCGSARAIGSWGVAAEAQTLEQDLRRQPTPAPDSSNGQDARLSALCESVERACATIDDLLDSRD
jgi:HPt (histidine-containing phosphotransfer) domain-containing protein